jgi:hypothetical protein
MKKILLIILAFTFLGSNLSAQQITLDSVNLKLENFIKKQEAKVFKFGLSVGVRGFLKREEDSRAIAYILPDSTVAIEHGDRLGVILSSALTAFPFDAKYKFWHNFGFVINVNLVEFTNSKVGSVFNKPIDGGLGFAYGFGPDRCFAIAATYERIAVQRPTRFVLSKEGQKILDGGKAVTTLEKTDSRYYIDSGLNGWSIKFIYHFN